jgi:hypothetical protein
MSATAKLARPAFVVGVVALALAAVELAFDPGRFLASWLFAWLFVIGISLGALANVMMHALTGGDWGGVIRAPSIAAARQLPLLALLFLPLLAGLQQIYPWTHAAAAIPGMEARHWWLNLPFFVLRAALCFACWIFFAFAWTSAARRGDAPRVRRLSCAGLLAYAVTVSVAAVDWQMSLIPQWVSTTFGLVVGVGQMLAGMAFAVWAAVWRAEGHGSRAHEAQPFHDLGNLLLMYVMTWAYLAFTQFLIIWAEDLPHEIAWYVPRIQTAWVWLGVFLTLFNFFLPFVVLLSRRVKRNPRVLGRIALALLFANLCTVYWQVLPSFPGVAPNWTDALCAMGLCSLWLGAWAWQMERLDASASKGVQHA